ncbi:hypothetical protein IFR05_004179 [Cadophora sp. M221]|nr:hypothetical protein IFR05_004179 [Cadophora sp. M221]
MPPQKSSTYTHWECCKNDCKYPNARNKSFCEDCGHELCDENCVVVFVHSEDQAGKLVKDNDILRNGKIVNEASPRRRYIIGD